MTIKREGGCWRNHPDSSNAILSFRRGNRGVMGAVAIAAVVYGALVVGRLASNHWDASFFISESSIL